MTQEEARERAAKIWGDFDEVRMRPDGSAQVVTRHMLMHYHLLNANGHPVCHSDCIAHEMLFEVKDRLEERNGKE